MKTVADGGIVSSDPPAENRDDFRRLRPQGRLRGAEGVLFSYRFPHSRSGFRSSAPLHNYTQRRWGIIGGRGTAAVRGRRGGSRITITKGVR